ncbi:hypothetical protein Q9S36_36620 [Microbacterium sp. ARD31]|nr:hypothetical protein [Microbacterium sp. ARD31]MDT0185726.1 hypothetical protein [Microbacterium sp. ARD31]
MSPGIHCIRDRRVARAAGPAPVGVCRAGRVALGALALVVAALLEY